MRVEGAMSVEQVVVQGIHPGVEEQGAAGPFARDAPPRSNAGILLEQDTSPDYSYPVPVLGTTVDWIAGWAVVNFRCGATILLVFRERSAVALT